MIGVFDSGVGGLSILQALRQRLPSETFCYLADTAYAPYGERTSADILARAQSITQWLLQQGAKLVVVACNTATAVAIHALRAAHPHIPFVGVEPALKLASLHGAQRVGVLATRLTLQSSKFLQLQHAFVKEGESRFAPGEFALVCVPCDGLAHAIEQQDTQRIHTLCEEYTVPLIAAQVDTVVLGCTHYVWVKDTLTALLGQWVRCLDVALPVALQTQRLWQGLQSHPNHPHKLDNAANLNKLGIPAHLANSAPPQAENSVPGQVHLFSTAAPETLSRAFAQWLAEPTDKNLPPALLTDLRG
jgi:glutamate racemase